VAKKYELEAQPPCIQTGCFVISLHIATVAAGEMIVLIGKKLLTSLYMAPAISWALGEKHSGWEKVVWLLSGEK